MNIWQKAFRKKYYELIPKAGYNEAIISENKSLLRHKVIV